MLAITRTLRCTESVLRLPALACQVCGLICRQVNVTAQKRDHRPSVWEDVIQLIVDDRLHILATEGFCRDVVVLPYSAILVQETGHCVVHYLQER